MRKRKMSKKKKKTIFSMVIILILVIIGGGYFILNNKDLAKKIKEKVEMKKLKIVDQDSKTRPYAVMINNHAKARINNAGLDDAYIVYEAIAEGGLTRLMAIFKDKDTDRIGSVRSSRPYFLDYALENDAIYVHFGGSSQALSDIKTLDIDNIDGMSTASAFWRDRTLGVALEHTAFTNMEKLKSAVSDKGYRTKTNKKLLLNYKVDEFNLDSKEDSIVANNISIPYSHYVVTSYTYDAEKKVYNRFVNGVAHTDGITKNQYTAKNIIVMKVNNYSLDSYGRQKLDNIGSGDGYYITNGYAVPIVWEKESRSSQTIYRYSDGTEIDVNDGNTYIQIQPITQELTIN